MIRVKEVNVIGPNGEPLGTFPTREALNMAKDQELDLVEVAPSANPPVCRIMDYGKFKYKLSKKAHDAKKNQKVVHLKEVKFRPSTDAHDFDFKLKHVQRFLEQGEKIMQRIIAATEDFGIIEQSAHKEGRTLVMILAPKSGKKKTSPKSATEFQSEQKPDKDLDLIIEEKA